MDYFLVTWGVIMVENVDALVISMGYMQEFQVNKLKLAFLPDSHRYQYVWSTGKIQDLRFES